MASQSCALSSFGTSAIVRIITRRPTIPSLPNAGVSYRRCWERRSFWHAHAITSPLRYERRSLRQTPSPLAFVVRWKCHFPDNFTGRQILPPARHNPTPPTNSIVAAASTSTRISSTGLHRTSRFIAPLPHQRHLQLHRNRFIAALRKPLRVRALAHCPSTGLHHPGCHDLLPLSHTSVRTNLSPLYERRSASSSHHTSVISHQYCENSNRCDSVAIHIKAFQYVNRSEGK